MPSLHRGIPFAGRAGLILCLTYPSTSPSQRLSPPHRAPWAPTARSHETSTASHQLQCPSTTVATAAASPHFHVPSVGVSLWGGCHSPFLSAPPAALGAASVLTPNQKPPLVHPLAAHCTPKAVAWTLQPCPAGLAGWGKPRAPPEGNST